MGKLWKRIKNYFGFDDEEEEISISVVTTDDKLSDPTDIRPIEKYYIKDNIAYIDLETSYKYNDLIDGSIYSKKYNLRGISLADLYKIVIQNENIRYKEEKLPEELDNYIGKMVHVRQSTKDNLKDKKITLVKANNVITNDKVEDKTTVVVNTEVEKNDKVEDKESVVINVEVETNDNKKSDDTAKVEKSLFEQAVDKTIEPYEKESNKEVEEEKESLFEEVINEIKESDEREPNKEVEEEKELDKEKKAQIIAETIDEIINSEEESNKIVIRKTKTDPDKTLVINPNNSDLITSRNGDFVLLLDRENKRTYLFDPKVGKQKVEKKEIVNIEEDIVLQKRQKLDDALRKLHAEEQKKKNLQFIKEKELKREAKKIEEITDTIIELTKQEKEKNNSKNEELALIFQGIADKEQQKMNYELGLEEKEYILAMPKKIKLKVSAK